MEHAISITNKQLEAVQTRRFGLDTTFVLFFLAMDLGSSLDSLRFDGLFTALTLAAFIALPYFLPFSGEKPEFLNWVIGRIFIAMVAVLAGLSLKMAAGTILPVGATFIPMTLLIISGIFCAGTQVYDIIRFRLAR